MFSIILFSICFCLASIAMYEPESESSTTVDNFEQFYSAVKEVFAIEPEVITESTEPLSSAQTNINSAWVTPEEQELINPTTQFTIRQLRDYVRQENLQATIKEQLGKSVNRCRLGGIVVDIVCLNLMRSLISRVNDLYHRIVGIHHKTKKSFALSLIAF